MKRYSLHIVGLLLMLFFILGCSTQKNTFTTRTYHKITSQFNILFNGNESLNTGLARIDEGIEDDFTRLLPVYKESDPSVGNMVKSEMDNAILKASKLIEIHSITAKPKRPKRRSRRYIEFASQEEFNPLVDDSYLLMGKAWYLQHNFLSAIENFSYILRKYPEGDARYEAQIWLIRSYTELERYTEASEVMQAVQNDKDFPRKLERDLAEAIAFFYIKQENYTEAVKFIDIALKRTFWRKQKVRLQYIEAQLYEELNKPMLAAAAYKKVTKLNPDYRMAFNAKIKAAGVFSDDRDSETAKKELRKLLRDRKNEEFRDQIYYALGNVFVREGNQDEAISNYRNSVASSYNNPFQRAQSAITLADIYFDIPNYTEAQSYYDSAMIIIDNNYPGYEELSEKYRSLTNLVKHILIVEREDSLQRVAQMPVPEREALIAQLMREEQERQRNMENLALQGRGDQSYYRSNRNRMGMGTPAGGGGGWYFYNPQTVAYGKVTFEQQWGQRSLEDNWRRSNKGSVSMDMVDEMDEMADSAQIVVKVQDPLQKEFYTQDLPLNDSLMEVSHNRIRDGLYNAGKIYKSEFNNYQRSAEAFEELIRRYPDNIYQLSAFFDLYDLYELMGDSQKSEEFKNIITSRYPESRYAQYLLNPNFFVEVEARKDSLNKIYEEIYRNYSSGNYRNVITLAGRFRDMDPDSMLIPKLEFMETVAQGTQTEITQFESLLQSYIGKWPKAEPTALASEILALIQDSTLADYQKLVDMGYINEEILNEEVLLANQAGEDEFGGKFTYDDDLLHYFVIAYPQTADVDLNRLKFDIANYNIDHYTKIDFDIETEMLNDRMNMITVRALGNKDDGLIYHRSIIRKEPVFQALAGTDYINFAVSSTNYRQILTDQSVSDYLRFFVKNYSRYIGSDFESEEQDFSPEELMAKAREEEQMLRERGEFRVVDTGADALFSLNINTNQNFILAVRDQNVQMQQVLNDFAAFNSSEFGGLNLNTIIGKSGDYQLLVVEGIPSLNEAMSYFRQVVITRSLFQPLGQATYRNFLITDNNLDKLIEENNVDEYIEFFRTNYIQRQAEPTQPVQDGLPQPQDETEIVQPEQIAEEPAEYTGPYSIEIEKPHMFVFVIPAEGVDKDSFIKGLNDFIASDDNALYTITEVSVDEFRNAVIINGLEDRESAARFSRMVVQNRELYTPLGSANYRNFLITGENFDVFLKEKNITEYMDFYKQIYLNQ